MIKFGKAPFLECSTKGDRRFSAFCAKIRARNYKSIEELYQAFKIFEGGYTNLSWREAKGRTCLNQKEAKEFYTQLWIDYINENPSLLEVLKKASGLSDIFGQEGHACQAEELWNIRNKAERV